MSQRLVRGALAALLLLSVGCFSDPLGRKYAFGLAQQKYTQLIRWGEISEASRFVAKDKVEQFRSWEPLFERLRVTDYEIGEFEPGEERDTLTVQVVYRAYDLHTFLEHRVVETQHWKRLEGRDWVVSPELSGFEALVSKH